MNKRVESELGRFIARDFKDVIALYDLIKHHHQNKGTIHRKIAYVYNEVGKRIIDNLIIASIESNDKDKTEDFSSDEFRTAGLRYNNSKHLFENKRNYMYKDLIIDV